MAMDSADLHEENARMASHKNEPEKATVSALLAIAAAIEHLANVLERQKR